MTAHARSVSTGTTEHHGSIACVASFRWIRQKHAGCLFPAKVLSRVFRGKFVEARWRAYARDELDLE